LPGVKIDVTNLLPTTKFESCSDELKKQIESVDTFILNQIHMCNEVTDLLPTIAVKGATVPNDVEFVQGKLDAMQHALENGARDIDHVRMLVSRDAAEAQVAFRAIDNLKLPLQYQSTTGGWWSVPDQQLSERQSLRSTIGVRKRTLTLPDDVETDPSMATSIKGVPVNLVEYFSQRSDEMHSVLGGYKRRLKEIEDHVHGIELTLDRQINEFLASQNRDGASGSAGISKSRSGDLAAVLGDVEAGIFGVASRLGGIKEQVQELVLGPLSLGVGRYG
jgi:nucleoporin p58/p45